MARNYLKELFEKAKLAAKNTATSVKRGLQNFNEITPDERNAGRNWAVKQGFKPTGTPATQGIKLTDVVRQTSQNVAQNFGDMFRKSTLGGNKLQPVKNAAANTAQTVGSGVSGATMNLMNFFQKPSATNLVRQGAGLIYNVAKPIAAATPFFQGANIATQAPQGGKLSIVPRTAKGIIQGMTGVKNLAPEVQEKKQKFFGMEFDPAVAGGEMLGFVKNPANAKLFKATEGINLAPFASKIAGNPGLQRVAAKVANFIATNSVRGSIEDIMMSLDELPEGASVQEQAKYLAEKGLWGAVSENVGRGFFKGTEAVAGAGSKALTNQMDKIDFKPAMEFLEDINVLRRGTEVSPAKATPRGPRNAEDIIRDAQGRFSQTPAEPVKKPKVDWMENPNNRSQLLRTEDGVVPQKPDTVPANAKFVQDPTQPSRYLRQEQAQSAAGLLGGIETEYDENGNLKVGYSPEKGMAGFFAAGAINSKGGKKIISEAGQRLFHGTDPSNVAAIKQGGFKVGGSAAHAYPQGIYFTTKQTEAGNYGDIIEATTGLKPSELFDLSGHKALQNTKSEATVRSIVNLNIKKAAEKAGVQIPAPTSLQRNQYYEETGRRLINSLDHPDIKTKVLSDMGYKGFVAPETGGTKEVVVFDPKDVQVKSDPTVPTKQDPEILSDKKTLFERLDQSIQDRLIKKQISSFGDKNSEYELVSRKIDEIMPSQGGDDYINDSSKNTAKMIASGNLEDIRQEDLSPILIDTKGNILDGNHRHAAAKMNGQETILVLQPKDTQSISQPKTPDEYIANAREQITKLPEEPKTTWREAWDRTYTDWVNRFHPIEKAVGAVEKNLEEQGAQLLPQNNPKYQIRRFLGMGGIAESKFQDQVKPVLDQMEKNGIEKLDMDAYLKARRDINLGEREIYGSDPVQAAKTVEAFEAKYGVDKLQPLAQQLYDFQNNLYDELTDAGFIKSDVAARVKATNADYVPFERVMDDAQLDEFLGIPTKKVVQGTNPADKRIKGSKRDIYSPIESIIANTYKYTAAVEKNKVARSVARLQEIMPELGFVPVKEAGADTIPVWVDGVKQHIKVGKDIADAAKGLNEESMNNILKIMQLPAQILRSGATGQNPEFMVPNVIRDQLEASLYSNYGYVPFVDYFRGMAHLINKSRTGSDEIVDAWMKSGASQELSSMSGRKSIEQFFNQKTGRKGMFGWLSDALDFMGKYSEQPTRIGLFEKAYNKTGNTNIAMMESRDATLDFSRMGSKMKVANSVIPFLNVGIQGFDKLIRESKNKPGKTAVKVAIYGLAPQIMSSMYNLVYHPEEYAEVPQFEKDGNFVFVQGRNDDGTVNYFTVPKANSMQTFVNPMENFLSYMAGTNQQSFGEFATAFLTNALPVIGEGSSPQEAGVRTVGSLTPQIIKPLAENLLNKSFFRYNAKKQETKEIVPYFMKDKAPGDQSYSFTPAAYKVIGKVFNVSPLQVQNLAEGYLAGYAKVPVQIVNLMVKANNGEEITPNEVTLARRFLKQTYPTSETEQKKRQAKETPLISQAGAITDIPGKLTTQVSATSGEIDPQDPKGGDSRNWFQKLFNTKPSETDSQPEELKLPSDDQGMEVMYKDAKSIIDGYEEKKTKYQYGRNTDPEGKLTELEADKAYAEQLMSQIEDKYPEKIATFEMKSYASGAGANVDERAEWAYNTIQKLGESGDTDKVTEFIDKLWDEKVLTGGKSGVAQKILEEYGINVFNYGKDAKTSKNPNSSGKSSAKKKAEKENQKELDKFFTAAAKPPKLNFNIKTPKSQIDWAGTFKAKAPASVQDAEFSTKVPKVAGAPDLMQSFFKKPKVSGVSPEAAKAVTAVRGGGRQDETLRLHYAGGRGK